MKGLKHFVKAIKQHAYIAIAVFVVGVGAVSALTVHIVHSDNSTSTTPTRTGRGGQQVTVASVASLSPNGAPLEVIGQVTSENEATILSQVSGEIVTVDVGLGDSVSTGETIANMENSAQQAAVVQAQGSYDAAQVALEEASGTTAENSTVTSVQADQNAQNTQIAAIASLQSTYTALDDAVHTKADTLLNNPRSQFPTLNIVLTYSNDTDLFTTILTEREGLEAVLSDANTLANSATTTNIDDSISTMIGYAQTVEQFLNNLSQAVNELTPDSSTASTISTFQTTIGAARTEVTSAVSSLTTAKTNYDSATASSMTAANSAGGGTSNSIAVAQANLEEALGALDAAQSALQKTIITSPISGTIVDLPVTSGDYVSSFSEVAKVSNPNALKIVTYVTATDAQTLSVGNAAMINDTIPGVITEIAPAIDPETGTIEVDVGLTGSQTGIIDGDSVTVDLDRSASLVSSAETLNASSTSSIIIPIVALKIMPTGPVVFTVDPATNTLLSHSVEIGSILGDDIVVTEGLTPDMVIVTDARGLVAGQTVSVKK